MCNENIIITTKEELKNAFFEWSLEIQAQTAAQESEAKTLSINKVAKRLGRSHSTISKMIREKIIRSTSDGKQIPVSALNEYLNNRNKNKPEKRKHE
jgi:excisionase family DNA binding protein